MVKFSAKLLLFLLLFFLFDKLFIIVANRSAEAEADKRLEYLLNGEINKEIIIMGTSRGSRDIIAERIETETGHSAFNLCYPGADVEFQEFILKTLLKFNKPPKIIILDVADSVEFKHDETVTFRRDRLYPLVRYPYVRQELINRGYMDKFFSEFLVISRLNKNNFDLRKRVFSPVDTLMDCGSMPITWQRHDIDWTYLDIEKKYFKGDEVEKYIGAYKEINEICDSNDITLVLVFPPLYRIHRKSFEERIRQITDENALFYVYNTANPVYRNKNYFYDKGHLMRNGAEIFTSELIIYLNRLIGEKGI